MLQRTTGQRPERWKNVILLNRTHEYDEFTSGFYDSTRNTLITSQILGDASHKNLIVERKLEHWIPMNSLATVATVYSSESGGVNIRLYFYRQWFWDRIIWIFN